MVKINTVGNKNQSLKQYLKVDEFLKKREYSLEKKNFRDIHALTVTTNNVPVFMGHLPSK